jgi:hypothetical protein
MQLVNMVLADWRTMTAMKLSERDDVRAFNR